MSKKPKTYVAIVLDKSGSMSVTKKQTIAGFNEQIQQMKMNSKDQSIFCSLVTFCGDVYEHAWNVPAKELTEITENDYEPNGSTSMRDAVGYTVQKLLETTDHKNEENAYLVVIISDGQTNSDKHFSISALKETIEACQSTNRWTFTYMGCSEDYLKEISNQTSIPISNMAFWQNSNAADTNKAFKNYNMRSAKYFAGRAGGQSCSANYMSDNPICAADFTADVEEQPVYEEQPKENVFVKKEFNGNWQDLVDKLPKYQMESVQTGSGLFGNINKVAWEKEDEIAINNRRSLQNLQTFNSVAEKWVK